MMAYKDEYEVARLHLDPSWRRAVGNDFGPHARVSYYFHPPVLRAMGWKRKIRLGQWFNIVLRFLRAGRGLRGTPFDPFGRTKLRRLERLLPAWYQNAIREALEKHPSTVDLALSVACLPDRIRGYEEIKEASAHGAMAEADRLLGRAQIS